MSKSSDKRPNLLSLLFSDPWRKLASILLAFLLWHYLDDQITDKVTLDLSLVTTSRSDHPGSNDTLLVFVDQSRYFENGYFDRINDAGIQEVRLTLRGSRHLIETIDENHGFKFTPAIDGITGKSANVEFTVEDLRAINPQFQALVDGATMSPASVRIELEQNEHCDLSLTSQQITFEGDPSLLELLQREEATFEPQTTARILGPADKVDLLRGPARGRVFVVRLTQTDQAGSLASGTLEFASDETTAGLRFADNTPITVSVPLAIPFKTFHLKVPYYLDQLSLPESRRRFRHTAEFAEIEVHASHNFRILLESFPSEEDKDEWVNEYCRLLVRLPSTARAGVYTPQFLILGSHFRYIDGRDYVVRDLKPLMVEIPKE